MCRAACQAKACPINGADTLRQQVLLPPVLRHQDSRALHGVASVCGVTQILNRVLTEPMGEPTPAMGAWGHCYRQPFSAITFAAKAIWRGEKHFLWVFHP